MSETRARVKITSREKGQTRWRERKLSPPRYLAFLAWGDFHARSRFACSTIPEEKLVGTTRSPQSTVVQKVDSTIQWNSQKPGRESLKKDQHQYSPDSIKTS